MVALWLVVVLVAGGGTAMRAWRRERLPRRSADAHRRALLTLDAITRHAERSRREADAAHQHVRLVRDGAHRSAPPAALRHGRAVGSARFRAPLPGYSADEPSDPDASVPAPPTLPAVLAGPAAASPPPLASPAGGSRRRVPPRIRGGHGPASARHHREGRHRRSRLQMALAAAALAVAGAGIALAAHRSPGATPAPRAAVPAPPTTQAPAPPPTTLAAPPATLVSSTPQVAVYSLSGPSTITLRASGGVSWAQLRSGDQSGTVVFEGRIDQGQSETISGPAWVRLGNPTAITVAVNGTAITAPTVAVGQPYNLQFS